MRISTAAVLLPLLVWFVACTARGEDRGQKPVVEVQVSPEYPPALKKAGISGSAEVEFIVEANGSVRVARAVKATHPEFGEAAVACILRWKFKPGRFGGRAVRVRMQQPFEFSCNPESPEPANPLKVLLPPPQAVNAGDVPPRALKDEAPGYPMELAAQRVGGTVVAEFVVKPNGTVDGIRIISTTDPRLGEMAKIALRAWRVEPPMRDGKPGAIKLRQVFEFQYVSVSP